MKRINEEGYVYWDLSGILILISFGGALFALYRIVRIRQVSRDVKLMAAYFIIYPIIAWLALEYDLGILEDYRSIIAIILAFGLPIWLLIGIPLFDATSDPEKAKSYRLKW